MMQTFAYYATVFYKRFAAYTAGRLQELGLNFGALFLILYVGRHPDCTQAELTETLEEYETGGTYRVALTVDNGVGLLPEGDGLFRIWKKRW